MSRIQVLPDEIINQIAAGEVIERPASVVKELIENACDAGARAIVVDVEGGGRRRIRVADDGEGLDRDDALLALERHATSKLRSAADLGRIVTLGFRGEALPAIASVSRLTLTSSRDGRSGVRVEVEAGRIRRVSEAGHPRGTTMDVRDLFYNTPARAKFLRSPQTELGHISELVAACAAALPATGMTLRHEGRALLEAPAAPDEPSRLKQVFGEVWADAIPLAGSRGPFEVRGFLLPPAEAPTRRIQHLYVNGRVVRDRLVSHAIVAACAAFLPKDRHATLFLCITCPPESVDVNVHPAKAEVRFSDGRTVHDLVQQAVDSALRQAMPIAPLKPGASARDAAGGFPAWRWPGAGPPASLRESVRLYRTADAASGPGEAAPLEVPRTLPVTEGAVALAHYRESYIVAEDREGLLLIDQHAAHERILFEGLLARAPDGGGSQRQRLLFPPIVELPRRLAPRMSEVLAELEGLGVGAEPFGDVTLKVTEAPSILEAAAVPMLLSDLVAMMSEQVDDGPAVRSLPRQRALLATVACHAAIKVRMPLTLEKMNYLINELFRTESPLKCPHGRPAVLRFTQTEIEKGFDRR